MLFNTLRVAAIFYVCLLMGCSSPESKNYERSFETGATEGFSELVNYGVKELGLGVPMSPEEMDKFMPYAEATAQKHNVSLYRESDLIDTDLFTKGIAKGRDVLLIYNGATLTKYMDLKEDRKRLEENGQYEGKAREEIARRFGRLLSYTPRTINNQLTLHTDFRTMYNFGIKATNVYFYYKNLKRAVDFYTKTLGMELVSDTPSHKTIRVGSDSYITLTDASIAKDFSSKPKTVAFAIVTDEIKEWFDYLQKAGVKMKYTYKPSEGKPHDSFVLADPEGYLLEFEKFYQHPENEDLMPLLKENQAINTSAGQSGLSINSGITWFYYKSIWQMEHFYQDVLGLELVCDQGWAKIYKSSETGFIGLVDEKRGMHSFSQEKAVKLSFLLDDTKSWLEYVQKNSNLKLTTDQTTDNNRFDGLDPEGYLMEFSSKN